MNFTSMGDIYQCYVEATMIICPNWQMEFHVQLMFFISYWHYIGLEYIIDKYDQVLVYVSHVLNQEVFSMVFT
jgi:hypothetical protein